MAKAKTSQKRKAFSPENMTPTNVKASVKTMPHDPLDNLKDRSFITKALFDCMVEGDMEEFKDTVRAHYEAVNTAKALKEVGLKKRTFYDAISEDGNPSLETVFKLFKGMKVG